MTGSCRHLPVSPGCVQSTASSRAATPQPKPALERAGGRAAVARVAVAVVAFLAGLDRAVAAARGARLRLSRRRSRQLGSFVQAFEQPLPSPKKRPFGPLQPVGNVALSYRNRSLRSPPSPRCRRWMPCTCSCRRPRRCSSRPARPGRPTSSRRRSPCCRRRTLSPPIFMPSPHAGRIGVPARGIRSQDRPSGSRPSNRRHRSCCRRRTPRATRAGRRRRSRAACRLPAVGHTQSASIWQRTLQPSPGIVLWSSQASPGSSAPSPHFVAELPVPPVAPLAPAIAPPPVPPFAPPVPAVAPPPAASRTAHAGRAARPADRRGAARARTSARSAACTAAAPAHRATAATRRRPHANVAEADQPVVTGMVRVTMLLLAALRAR